MKLILGKCVITILLLCIVQGLVYAQEGPSETEPNNTRDEATVIRSLMIIGEVGSGDDMSDWYQLDVLGGDEFSLMLSFDEIECQIAVEIYDDDEMIEVMDRGRSPDDVDVEIDGDCFVRVYSIMGFGYYTIEVEQEDVEINTPVRTRDDEEDEEDEDVEEDDYRTGDCEGPDESEPNNNISHATVIDGDRIEGRICGDEVDWFLLEDREDSDLSVTLTYDDDECDIDLEILSDNDVEDVLDSVYSPDSTDVSIDGICYINVFAYDGDGPYTITIEDTEPDSDRDDDRAADDRWDDECEGADEDEPNDSRSRANTITEESFDGIICEDDEDWFTFDFGRNTSDYYTVVLHHDDDDADLDIEVFSDREEVGSLMGVSSPDEEEFEIEDDLFIRVYSYSGNAEYWVEVYPSDGDTIRSSGDCEGPSENEPNDELTDADVISGLTIRGYACEDDIDFFLLAGQEGYHPTITLYYNDNLCDIDCLVWSLDEVAGELDSVSSPDSDNFHLPEIGILAVFAYSGEGDYTIEIEP